MAGSPKKVLEKIQSYKDVGFIFGFKMTLFPKTRFFIEKPINITFMYLLVTFIVQN